MDPEDEALRQQGIAQIKAILQAAENPGATVRMP